uniref:Uncharacterized protein n=1 Tax=Oncorhynchus tshawytscha TaxID=74940 RepID=A0A8C8C3F2_ONCTS
SVSSFRDFCSSFQSLANVKDYYQKWMEEKAQSLIDKTSRRMPFNRGKIPPSPFTGSLVRYVFIGGPPHPGMLPVPGPHMNGHGPPMMQMRGPSPHGMMPGMRTPMGHMQMMPGPH